jgi:hypothetical protein
MTPQIRRSGHVHGCGAKPLRSSEFCDLPARTESELSPGVEVIPDPFCVVGRLQRVSIVRRPRR